jgi:hypothetical protein
MINSAFTYETALARNEDLRREAVERRRVISLRRERRLARAAGGQAQRGWLRSALLATPSPHRPAET